MQDGEADGTWFTDCGHAFNLEAGAPAENKMKFCCYCGKPTRAPGVAPTLPAPKLCPRCCQYHGPICPAGVKGEGNG